MPNIKVADQIGFIHCRQGRDNTRRTNYIIKVICSWYFLIFFLSITGIVLMPICNHKTTPCILSTYSNQKWIELLAAAICLNPKIEVIWVKDKNCKLTLFADKVLLTLTNPQTTLPNLHYSSQDVRLIHLKLKKLLSYNSNFNYHWKESSLKYCKRIHSLLTVI